MNKLVLFDIDNTLIKISKGHKAAFSEAFKKVYGINTSIEIISYHGMTDQQIIVEVLKKKGLREETIKSKIKDCMKVMIESFNRIIEQDKIVVLGGVRELLEKLNKHNVLMGLITGNLESIARSKLKKVNINHYFKIGGFGSDDINRTNLVRIAIKRAKRNFSFIKSNVLSDINNVFLIGDGPREINAGKEAGVKTIGVCTGIYTKEDLKDAGADFVLENLKNISEVLKIILS